MIVDARFQWSVIWHVSAQSAFTLLLATASLLVPLVTHLTGHAPDEDCVDEASVLLYLHENWWWVAATSLLCAALAALRMSHRIAGPLVRFKRKLAELGRGVFDGPLRTRSKDYLGPEVEILNHASAELAARFATLRESQAKIADRLREALRELEFASGSGAREAVLAAQAATTRLAEELRCPASTSAPAVESSAPTLVVAEP